MLRHHGWSTLKHGILKKSCVLCSPADENVSNITLANKRRRKKCAKMGHFWPDLLSIKEHRIKNALSMRLETFKRLTTTVVIFLSLYGIIKFYDANVRPVVLKNALSTFSASKEDGICNSITKKCIRCAKRVFVFMRKWS